MKQTGIILIAITILLSCLSSKKSYWNDNPSIKDIPEKKISGVIAGKEFVPQYIKVEELDEGGTVIHFYDRKPDKLCPEIMLGCSELKLFYSGEIRKQKYLIDTEKEKVWNAIMLLKNKEKTEVLQKPVKIALEVVDFSKNDFYLEGKILLSFLDDNKSFIAGTFFSEYCMSSIKTAEKLPEVNDILWGQKIEADKISNKPIKGFLAGRDITIDNVLLSKTDDGGFMLSFLSNSDNLKKAEGFIITTRNTLQKGKYRSTSKDDKWNAYYRYKKLFSNRIDHNKSYYFLTLSLDKIDYKMNEASGKIYLWFDDRGKSMLNGTFTASISGEF